MRIARGASDPRGRMTGRAITLDVAADASVQVALSFPGVVAGAARPVRPGGLRWVEAAAAHGVAGRTGERDTGALVTTEAKRLLLVAARTRGVVLAGRDGVQVEKVVRMDA